MDFKNASKLGFGCASLGSRVARSQGLRAMSEAFELGVNWFDVAPSYGDGAAEAILGEFAKPNRDRCFLCTKVGILPPRVGLSSGLVKPVVRLVQKRFPFIRRLVIQHRPPPIRNQITAASIQDGINSSLSRMRTDYVDALLLHEPTQEEVENEENLRALEDIVRSGKARRVGVAGHSKAINAALNHRNVLSVFQLPADDLDELQLGPTIANTDSYIVTHSIAKMRVYGEYNTKMIKALVANSTGTVLVSMYSTDHINANCSVARAAGY